MIDISFTLIVCKQTGGEISQMNDIFFILNFHCMQINKWEKFTHEGHLFCINGMQISKWHKFRDKQHMLYINDMQINRHQHFTDEGHLFYIQPPCYANKQVTKF